MVPILLGLRDCCFFDQKVEIIMDGRVLLIDMEKNGCKMRIINVYGSTDMQERVLLLQTLQYYICNGRHVIIGGDFNCNLEKRIGNTSACLTNRVDLSSQALNNLIKDSFTLALSRITLVLYYFIIIFPVTKHQTISNALST
uniref:Endonuclease/exonuclease/phosphatase domain-containing protein n=1 Tax=Xiphophorus couchianus TaxID=32473 RepID=A0A3B5LSL0_9TELE